MILKKFKNQCDFTNINLNNNLKIHIFCEIIE